MNKSHETDAGRAELVRSEFRRVLYSLVFIQDKSLRYSMLGHAKHLYLNMFHPFDHNNRRKIKQSYRNFIRKIKKEQL